jgi:hypothetical protein
VGALVGRISGIWWLDELVTLKRFPWEEQSALSGPWLFSYAPLWWITVGISLFEVP